MGYFVNMKLAVKQCYQIGQTLEKISKIQNQPFGNFSKNVLHPTFHQNVVKLINVRLKLGNVIFTLFWTPCIVCYNFAYFDAGDDFF